MTKILIFDNQISGHHSEYLCHLINHIHNINSLDEYYFVVHPQFLRRVPEIVGISVETKKINWVPLNEGELLRSERSGLFRKSITVFRIMHKYAIHYNVDHALLLNLNIFQFSLGIFTPPYTISGILFKQFVRLKKSTNFLKYRRKFFQTWLFTLNKKITRVYILNDQKSADVLNSMLNTNIFSMLPDPISQHFPLEGFNIYEGYNIPKSKKIFLHFGSLSDRKGTIEILEALTLLPPNVKKNSFFLLVGKSSAEFEKRIKEQIRKLGVDDQVFWDNTFVSNAKMKSLFDQCYCVLIPYKNLESSSGILGYAAASFKPVIGPSSGLIGELIMKYNLGYGINNCLPESISEAIEFSLEKKFVADKRNIEFINYHRPEDFACILMKKILP